MSALFIILGSLTMTRFSEKMLIISTRCIHGFMSNLIKKSWTDLLKEWESVKVSMQIYTPRNPGILEQCQGLGMWLFFEKNRSIYYSLNTVLWQGFYICSIEAIEKFIWIIQFIMCIQIFVTSISWYYNNILGSFILIFWVLRHS